MTEECQHLLDTLNRLETQVRTAKTLLSFEGNLLPCKEFHPGFRLGQPRFQIGDFIIEDTIKAVPVEIHCSAEEFVGEVLKQYPENPEVTALFKP